MKTRNLSFHRITLDDKTSLYPVRRPASICNHHEPRRYCLRLSILLDRDRGMLIALDLCDNGSTPDLGTGIACRLNEYVLHGGMVKLKLWRVCGVVAGKSRRRVNSPLA
ncbi:MAG: hypothetical protein R2932_44525 [Caldilineaceae bacterium]